MSVATLEPPLIEQPNGERRSKRLLLIAYNFPPVGGAGVQRPVKWAKYLGRFGWDVTVLTTLNPSVPARDESLLADLPPEVNVVRARTWEPGYRTKQNLIGGGARSQSGLLRMFKNSVRGFAKRCVKLALQPDPQVLWNHEAIRAGARVLREQPHDAILVTAPAYSSFYIGAALKRRFHLPLILDYRDEWDLSGRYLENAQRDWISRVVQSRMQRRLLRCADAVVATTARSTEALSEKLAALRHPIPSHCVYNGFDAEDFAASAAVSTLTSPSKSIFTSISATVPAPVAAASNMMPPFSHGCDVMLPERGTYRLVYTGTLWNLTDIQPLVRGIEHLDRLHPELSRRLELVCVGRKTPEQLAVLDRLRNTSTRVVGIDYCDHSTALQWLRSSHGLCLLLSDVPGADRVVPAKLFEYLAMRREMLAICPAGETADIVRRFHPDGQFTPDEVQPICEWLRQRIAGVETRNDRRLLDDAALGDFSRESQTRRLAEILDSLVPSR
jgi:glycosyltransferase involved in cell wall biosynthesis